MESSGLSVQAPIYVPGNVRLADGSGSSGARDAGPRLNGRRPGRGRGRGRGRTHQDDASDGPGSAFGVTQQDYVVDQQPEQHHGQQQRQHTRSAPHNLGPVDPPASSAGPHGSEPEATGPSAAARPAAPRGRGSGRGRGGRGDFRGRDPQHGYFQDTDRGLWQRPAAAAHDSQGATGAASWHGHAPSGTDWDAASAPHRAQQFAAEQAVAARDNAGEGHTGGGFPQRQQHNNARHQRRQQLGPGAATTQHGGRYPPLQPEPQPAAAGGRGNPATLDRARADASTSGDASGQAYRDLGARSGDRGGRGRGGFASGRRVASRERGGDGDVAGVGFSSADFPHGEGAWERQALVNFGRQRGGRRADGRGLGGNGGGRGRGRAAPGAPGVANGDVGSTEYGGTGAAEAAAKAAGGSDGDNDGEETLTCVICCEEVAAVALGGCGHSHTCAKCCLRLRLCYRDLRCPLCKTVNREIVVARPPLPPGSSFESLAGAPQQREALWQLPKWAKGVLVYDLAQQHAQHPGGGPDAGGRPQHSRRPLHKALLAMTSFSCSLCDPQGRQPFPTMKLLLGHLRSAHDRALCDVCLGAGLRFPLEYPALDAAGLAAHCAAEHPRCEYCDLSFYGKDELYGHMTQRHFTCHVCLRLGRHHLYFQDADTLLIHLREEHHACENPDCFGCMIAFATRDELNAHIRDRHSAYMPRWDQSRARPLLLDFITPRGPAAAAALATDTASPSGHGGRGNDPRSDRRGRGAGGAFGGEGSGASGGDGGRRSAPHQLQRSGQGRSELEDLEAFPSLQAQAQPGPAQYQAGLGDVREMEGGLAVIDDDLGMDGGSAAGRIGGVAASARRDGGGGGGAVSEAAGPGPGPAAVGRLAGAWAGRQPGSGTFREDFPELSAAAGSALRGGTWGHTAPHAGSAPQQPNTTAAVLLSQSQAQSLVKVTVRCPCGNKVDHLALRPDEKPLALRCDRECVARKRRAQLADAFGVESADIHVPYFDRHRTPNFPPELILAAQAAGLEWVSALERDLARFLADSSARRTSLAAGMSQPQRKLAHELAEHYGLASHSIGQGTARAVQLLKGAASGLPTRLLSAVAAVTPPEELTRLVAVGAGGAGGAGGWEIRLVDVAPDANVQRYLRAWEGEYTLSPAPGSSTSSPSSLILTFSREAAFRDCCGRLGGGVRGVFRTQIDRKPEDTARAAAASTAPPPPPGWRVLRGNVSAACGRRLGGAATSSAAASSVRAALAAEAWASDEGEGERRPELRVRGGARLADAAVAAPSSRVAAEPRVPGRGPPLDLAKETVWSALLREEGEGEEEREDVDGEEGSFARKEMARCVAAGSAAAARLSGEAGESWEDADAAGGW